MNISVIKHRITIHTSYIESKPVTLCIILNLLQYFKRVELSRCRYDVDVIPAKPIGNPIVEKGLCVLYFAI